ncbi:M23 family metallopeptidase [Skermanella stibiiresistens]|uniref:M23 family metallopeptidase n=1 Tax=Skermanella stibiiresistens TaxID=913326 RepID=UPI0004B105E1|nr:M23 family metallopeptidase [Skermanella stibiiresistens]
MRLRVAAIPALAVCLAGVPTFALADWEYPYNAPIDTSRLSSPTPQPPVDLDQEAARLNLTAATSTAEEAETPLVADADSDDGGQSVAKALNEPLPDEGQTELLADIDRKVVEVGRGDTLLGLLVNASVPRLDAHDAIEALRSVFDPRRLQVGQEIALLFQQESGTDRRFVGMELQPDVDRAVSVARLEGDAYEAVSVDKELRRHQAAASAVIDSSLFEAGASVGVPIPVMAAMIRAYSYDVDFQRDVQPGDEFQVMYERYLTDKGASARDGDILYAALTLGGRRMDLYRYKTRDGIVDYFNRRGESIRKALLRTPIDGARVSSKFGMRRHPVLGFSKMHAGMDFAAPSGTPIYAAGNGVIEEIGGKGSYGNYIRIKHNQQMATAYAHLSKFGSGLRRGGRVQQGDIIGYVGTTGRSTGPHLHYEVLRGGRQVNPMSVDLPTGVALQGRELVAFQRHVEDTDRQFAENLQSAAQVAQTAAASGDEPHPEACRGERSC